MRPGSEDFVAVCGYGQIIAEEIAFGFKRFIIEAVILKFLAAVGGTGQRDSRLLVITAAVIEDQVDCPACGVYRHPLKKLVGTVVNGIVVHAYRSTPCFSMIAGGRDKYVHVSIAVVAPGYVEVPIARINAKLWESIGAGNAGQLEKTRSGFKNAPFFAE